MVRDIFQSSAGTDKSVSHLDTASGEHCQKLEETTSCAMQ